MGILIKWGFVTGILLLAVTTDTISQNQSNFKADQEVESYVKDTVVLRIQEYVGEFIQWQKSPDMVVWLDIPNANADTLEIVSDGISSNYYRSKVFAGTCNPFMSSVVAVRFFDLSQLETNPITSILAKSAISGGQIISDGGTSITSRGIVWSVSNNPTLENNNGFTDDGTGTGTWVSNLTELSPNTTYYVRAYATNNAGTQYGNQQSFTTLATLPQVTTTEVSSITATTADSGGEVTDDGGATVTARGIVWNTSENPTLDDNDGFTQNGSGTGIWVSELSELIPNQTYYVRAYATNSAGTQYGNQQSFTTLATLPQVTTTEVSSITATTADSGGDINADGGAVVTARGVCWGTSQSPTINDSFTEDGTGTGSYISSVTGLIPNTTYYIRAYATNSVGTAYGNEVSFTTLQLAPVANFSADVTTGQVPLTVQFTDLSTNTPTSWSWDFGDGNTSDAQNPQHTYTNQGIYTVALTATNGGGSHTETKTNYITVNLVPVLPTVTTTDVSNVMAYTATSGGNVTHNGNADITARGVCWSTSQNPTINDSYTEDGTGTGSYVSSVTGLIPNTTYYLRAYATNSVGTAYGEQKTFTTATVPTAITADITNILTTTAMGGGNVTASGGVAVTAKGVVWSTSQNPTITSNLGITNNGTGTGSFTSSITSLTAGTTYYVRAYATNEAGTAYGGEKSFTTIQLATVTTTPISNLTSNSVSTGGSITSDGGSPVTARGVCYSTSENPTLDDNFTEDGTGTGEFTSNLTDLTATTTYYVRAYAITLAGTAYGNQIVFNTISPTQIADIDNNVYNTVTLGDQVWMKENLKTTKFSNGVAIPNVTDNNQWSNLTSYAYSEYDNSSANVSTYGRLYNSYAVFSDNGLCPTGWRMPTIEDVQILYATLSGSEIAGGKMKTTGTSHWRTPNEGATNESGFSGLPGGLRYGLDGTFIGKESSADFALKAINGNYKHLFLGLSYLYAHSNIGQQPSYDKNGYSVRCIQGEDTNYLPIVSLNEISSITNSSGNIYGIINYESGIVSERGYYWSETPNAEISGTKIAVGGDYYTSFTSTLSGLNPNSTYYIKGYAINTNGTAYSEEITFTTLPIAEPIFDIDGNEYTTANYGTQIWMTENLRTSKYRNGEDIPNLTLQANWGSTSSGAWCYHSNNEANNIPFGKLYNYYTTVDERGLCPEGWHVPTQQEWITLVNYLGGIDVAGGKMKIEGTTYWESPNTGATNESGFNAYGAGDRTQQGDDFGPMKYSCAWWSSTVPSAYPTRGYNTILNHTSAGANYNYDHEKNRGISVRCVRDMGLQETLPTISTNEVTSITNSTATCGGNVTNSGGASVTARGVVWSTTENPTVVSNQGITTNGSGTGTFTSSLTELSPSTTYYLRAYATNSMGTTYGNSIVFKTAPGNIGDSYGGGVIAYIFQPGDPGYVAGEVHGLIATPSDQSTSANWGCYGTTIDGTSGALGTGMANTLSIVNGCSEAGIAARICNDLVLNGYSDWYLPSKDELNKFYINRAAIGGFAAKSYWSSTEYNATHAWEQHFDDGGQGGGHKGYFGRVRAVRAF